MQNNNVVRTWLDLAAKSNETVTAGGESYAVIGTTVDGIGVIARYAVTTTDKYGDPVAFDRNGPVGGTLVNGQSASTGGARIPNIELNPIRVMQTISLALVRTSAELKGNTVNGVTIGRTAISINANGNTGTGLSYPHAVIYSKVNLIQSTCQTPDLVIPLGTVPMSTFQGAGVKTSNWVERPLMVNNCPAGLNHVMINFRTPQSGWLDQANRVFKLSNPDAVGTAKGVGIQMYVGSSSSIATYESRQELTGYRAIAATGGNFAVPIGARYYKPASSQTLSGGSANGGVTFDMIYD